MAESFISKQRFFDNKNYPRGFARHGDFTIKESQILERLGHAFNELCSGNREPVTTEEKAFVDFCRGEKSAATENEKTWDKYLKRIQHPKRFHTLSGGKPQVDAMDDFSDNDD